MDKMEERKAAIAKLGIAQGCSPWDVSDLLKIPETELLVAALGEKEINAAFDEYVELRRDIVQPIAARDYIARVYAMVGDPEPTYHTLRRQAREPHTDEPWPEALFAYRTKRHLESRDAELVDWKPADYHALTDSGERRRAREVAAERYRLVLEILARLLEDRHLKILEDVRARVRAEVELVTDEGVD